MKKFTILCIITTISIHMSAQLNWTSMQSLPFGICGSASFVIGNSGYVVGGSTGAGGWISSTLQYDAVNDQWTQKADAGNVQRLGAT
jgi:N-acetylneuraminic acid mutarotase